MYRSQLQVKFAKRGWAKKLIGASAVATLLAVPLAGLGVLGAGLTFQPDSLQSGVSGILAFDAPAVNVMRDRNARLLGQTANDQESAVLLTDWSYTASKAGGGAQVSGGR